MKIKESELVDLVIRYRMEEKPSFGGVDDDELLDFARWIFESSSKSPVTGRYSWLEKDDLDFAIALQEENKLEAVKWLCEKARGHSLTPLKDAKDILDAYL